jgi:hypothetical protein
MFVGAELLADGYVARLHLPEQNCDGRFYPQFRGTQVRTPSAFIASFNRCWIPFMAKRLDSSAETNGLAMDGLPTGSSISLLAALPNLRYARHTLLASLAIQPPYPANRHNAGGSGAGRYRRFILTAN